MHVAIDVSPLSSGHKSRGTGIYTKQLVEALKTFQSAHTYSLITKRSEISKDADIVHYPFFDPFFLTLPLRKAKPTVVTVHDLIPIAYPDHFPKGIRGSLAWQIQRRSLKGASCIITDSEHSKQDIERLTGIAGSRIRVVYLAPPEGRAKVTDVNVLKHLQDTYRLRKPFILYVGDVNWNKNIPGLLRAFNRIVRSDPNVRLVFVGGAFTNTSLAEVKHIDELIASYGLGPATAKLGHISDEDLSGLYTLAACVVLPSFAEGFGFPVLEAMKCGSPVVVARTSSLVEISGPAVTVNPADPGDIARGIRRVLHLSLTGRRKMVNEGTAWVRQFTWENVARETVAVYQSVLRKRRGI